MTVQKCMHIGCSQDATWKGVSTKASIAKIDDEFMNKIKHLLKTGTFYYCDKHRDEIGAYGPHLKFEKLRND